MFKALTVVGLAALAAAYPTADKVAKLDQMPDLSFGLYSGYVPIDGTQKQLHYMAALSRNNPTSSPNIVWFNGGPGCSSMLGFL
jgi:carboxypeptidase C (cathepsin A)